MPEERKRRFRTGPDGSTQVEEEPAEVEGPLDEMTFSAHILSLNAMALMYLGELGDGEVERDRAAAKHVIDTLAMLRAKTEGNLSREEARLIDALLHELRLKFVRA